MADNPMTARERQIRLLIALLIGSVATWIAWPFLTFHTYPNVEWRGWAGTGVLFVAWRVMPPRRKIDGR